MPTKIVFAANSYVTVNEALADVAAAAQADGWPAFTQIGRNTPIVVQPRRISYLEETPEPTSGKASW